MEKLIENAIIDCQNFYVEELIAAVVLNLEISL
jgi:hypothetical protein